MAGDGNRTATRVNRYSGLYVDDEDCRWGEDLCSGGSVSLFEYGELWADEKESQNCGLVFVRLCMPNAGSGYWVGLISSNIKGVSVDNQFLG